MGKGFLDASFVNGIELSWTAERRRSDALGRNGFAAPRALLQLHNILKRLSWRDIGE